MTAQQYVHDILQQHVLPFVEAFFNKIMLGLTRRVSSRAYLESFGTASWAFHEFERTRGKGTSDTERNVSRHHTEVIHLQWIPPPRDLEENQIVGTLAKADTCDVPETSASLTFLEIFSRTKHLNTTAWIALPQRTIGISVLVLEALWVAVLKNKISMSRIQRRYRHSDNIGETKTFHFDDEEIQSSESTEKSILGSHLGMDRFYQS
ncbi:RNase H domain-containing protein [Trichonephila clavipes]|nr:RNase H domain-containing protein [Trichonephila clavipes]